MRKFGLIGKSLSHSFSKNYFQEKFLNEGIGNCQYDLYPLSDINQVSKLWTDSKLLGLNVTIPYKEEIIPFLTELSAEAKEIGAVNTIKLLRENNQIKSIGYNTDAFGFAQSIKPFIETQHQKALILGDGGAAKAVKYVFKQLGIDFYSVVRNKPQSPGNYLLYSEVSELVMSHFKLVVNTTPLGTYPHIHEAPPIPMHFHADGLVVDLIYNPERTKLLSEAAKQGSVVLNGLSMLKHQANKAWEIWNM